MIFDVFTLSAIALFVVVSLVICGIVGIMIAMPIDLTYGPTGESSVPVIKKWLLRVLVPLFILLMLTFIPAIIHTSNEYRSDHTISLCPPK